MALRGTDPESYITENTLLHEEEFSGQPLDAGPFLLRLLRGSTKSSSFKI